MAEENIKTREELAKLAVQLRQKLESGLTKTWALLERPYPLALMFLADKNDKADLRSHEFESVVSAYYGVAAELWVPEYLKLHATLQAKGLNSAEQSYEFGNDAYVWAAADRTSPEPSLGLDLKALLGDDYEETPRMRQAKAIVLETQSRSFLIVLNQSYDRWTVHMREFWPDIRIEVQRSRYLSGLEAVKDRRDLTLMDVVLLSNAANRFGDDLPGVHYPHRPHLSTLLGGSLMAGAEDAGIGLRYGDFRDRGYIMSLKTCSEGRPTVEHGLHASYGDIAYVAFNLASAIDCLSEEDA